MCHPNVKKEINKSDSNVPEDIPEITDIPSHNQPGIDAYVVVINGQEHLYFTSDEMYEAWMNTEEIYSNNN